MSRFEGADLDRARQLVSLYPDPRSATIPLCHLAQERDGYLKRDAMRHIAELTETEPSEVYGTASFYDMLHTAPVGKYVVGVCTNIACLLEGAEQLLDDAVEVFGTEVGGTTDDGQFTLEELECMAHCDQAPCVTVNYRYFGKVDKAALTEIRQSLLHDPNALGVPPHGVLNRIERSTPELIPLEEIDAMRQREDEAKKARIEAAKSREEQGS